MKMNRARALKSGLSGVLCCGLPFKGFGGSAAELTFSYCCEDISENLATVQTEAQGQTKNIGGFIMIMQGQPYLITAQHALLGADRLHFSSPSGREIKPRRIELSTQSDVVRLALADGPGLAEGTAPEMGSPVAVFGSTELENAQTEIYGEVNGIGADIIEISAPFAAENSGCPVLNADRQVLAMASYTRESRDHIMKTGTRFENRTRRFCQRLNGMQWQAVNWKKFNEAFGVPYLNCRTMLDDISQILNSWADGPLDVVPFEGRPQKPLGAWLEKHNAIVSESVDIGSGRREFYAAYSESAAELSKQCRTQSRESYLLAEQRGLTDFLIDEFESYGAVFQAAADIIDRYGSSTY